MNDYVYGIRFEGDHRDLTRTMQSVANDGKKLNRELAGIGGAASQAARDLDRTKSSMSGAGQVSRGAGSEFRNLRSAVQSIDTARLNRSLAAYGRTTERTRDQQRAFSRSTREVAASLARQNARPAAEEIRRYGREARSAAGATRDLNRETRSLSGSFSGLRGAIAAVGLGLLVQQTVGVGTALESVDNSFLAVTGSAGASARELAFVRQEAARLGQDFLALATSHAQLTAAAAGTSLAEAEIREISIAVSEAMTVLGRSTDDARGAMRAIEQIMSKGSVQAEELRGQLGERVPGAFIIAARAMGVTEKQLNKMLEQGEVLAEDFLPRFARELRSTFAAGLPTAMTSTRAELNRLSNAFRDAQQAFNQSGFLAGITRGAVALAEALRDPEILGALDRIGELAGDVLTAAAENLDLIAAAGIGLAAAKIASTVAGIAASMRLLNIALLANPFTAIPAAIGLAVGAMIAFGDSAEDADTRITNLSDALDVLRTAEGDVRPLIDDATAALKDQETQSYATTRALERAIEMANLVQQQKRIRTEIESLDAAAIAAGQTGSDRRRLGLMAGANLRERAQTAAGAQTRSALELSERRDALEAELGRIEEARRKLLLIAQAPEITHAADAYTPPPSNRRPKKPAVEDAPKEDKAITKLRRELRAIADEMDPLGGKIRKINENLATLQAGLSKGLIDPAEARSLANGLELQLLALDPLAAKVEEYTSMETFSAKAMAEAEARQRALEKTRKDGRKALEEAVVSLAEELELAQLSERDRQVEIESRNLLNLAKAEGLELNDREIEQLREIAAQHVDAQIAIEERKRAEERAAAAARQTWERVAGGIQSSLAGAFRSALDGGVDLFSQFRDRVIGIFKDLAAEIAASLVLQPVLGGISQSFGAQPGAGTGSLLGGLGQNLAGSLVSKILPDFGINAALGSLGSSLFGVAPSVVATNVGSIGAASAATSGIVGSGGSLFGLGAAGGPLALGALAAGGLVFGGKLFGDNGVGPNAGARIGFDDAGQAFLKATGADNGGNTGRVVAEAERAIAALNAISAQTGGRYDTAGIDISLAIREFAKQGGLHNTADDLVRDILESGVLRNVEQSTIDDILEEGVEPWLQASAAAAQEADRLASAFTDAAASLRGAIEDLQLSDLSPLSADKQLSRARASFDNLAAQVDQGDLDSLTDLPTTARAFLEKSKAFHGSAAPQYLTDFNAVAAVLNRAAARAEEEAIKATEKTSPPPVQEVTAPALQDELQALKAEVQALGKTNQRLVAEAQAQKVAGGATTWFEGDGDY